MKNGKSNQVQLVGESGTGQDRENPREKTTHNRAQSAAEPVTLSVQPLHPHRTPTQTPTPIPEWDGGTSGSHNGDYLQPQWGNNTKMPLPGETGEMERDREREAFQEMTCRGRMAGRRGRDPWMAFASIWPWREFSYTVSTFAEEILCPKKEENDSSE